MTATAIPAGTPVLYQTFDGVFGINHGVVHRDRGGNYLTVYRDGVNWCVCRSSVILFPLASVEDRKPHYVRHTCIFPNALIPRGWTL